ncbi:uncharacterized protein TNIN_320131 [Trichonephila inaurata madagascariensis]|uniref:Uncharacterized protein n=1 Tax=Trichonephila inaurata madagascariensis TaxID=2747483 RepID=A0A8X6XFS8_9ARAC|nr:uncharacterized protein TNIN_320131 [Trichonephila inaurata madagascariensis]
MHIKFQPSLKLIVLVRIAKKILYSLCLRVKERKWFSSRSDVTKKYSSEIALTIKKLFSGLDSLHFTEKQIFGIIKSLNLEIQEWFYHHRRILHGKDLYFFQTLCWRSYGIIDTFETAHRLVQDDNVKIEERFDLSCKYFFDDYARILWKKLSLSERKCLVEKYDKIERMKYVIAKLRFGLRINSIKMFRFCEDKNYFRENYLGLRYYFKNLEPKAKYLCLLHNLNHNKVHHFDLYLCFAEMDIKEIKSLFHSLGDSCRFRIIKSFLRFPLQALFTDIVTPLWSYISPFNYRNVLHFMIHERIRVKWRDFDYIQLMKYLWHRCPKGHRKSFKKDKLYNLFERIVWTPPYKGKPLISNNC